MADETNEVVEEQEETALVPGDENTAVEADGEVYDVDTDNIFGDDESHAEESLGLTISRYAIEYGVTRPDCNKGEFTVTNDPTHPQKKEIVCTVLKLRRSRCLFEEVYDPSKPPGKPTCKSSDGCTPDMPKNEWTAKYKGPCGNCELGQFLGGSPPKCKESYTILAWDWETNSPFMFAFKGSGIKVLRYTLIKEMERKRAFRLRKDAPLCCWIRFKLVVDEEKNYYIPGCKDFEGLTEEEAAKMFAQYMQFEARFQDMNAALTEE